MGERIGLEMQHCDSCGGPVDADGRNENPLAKALVNLFGYVSLALVGYVVWSVAAEIWAAVAG